MIQVSALLCLPFACLCFLCPGGLLIWIGAFPCGFCRRFFVCFYWIRGCPACRTTGRGGVGCNAVVVSFGYALGAWALCSGYKQVPLFLVTVCFYAGALQQRMKQEGGIGCV